MMSTAAITANISIKPATDIAIAKLRCDTQIASSGVCNGKHLLKYISAKNYNDSNLLNDKDIWGKFIFGISCFG